MTWRRLTERIKSDSFWVQTFAVGFAFVCTVSGLAVVWGVLTMAEKTLGRRAPAAVAQVAPAPDPIVAVVYEGEMVSAWYEGKNVGPRTCASREFARGTWLVLEGRRGVRRQIRVNDYGPADPRTGTRLDCSRDIARDLGFEGDGHGRVKVWRVILAPAAAPGLQRAAADPAGGARRD